MADEIPEVQVDLSMAVPLEAREDGVDTSIPLFLGEDFTRFSNLGFEQRRVWVHGTGWTKYQAILRNGKLVVILGKDYALLPNEVALDIGEEVAKKFGAVPHPLGHDYFETPFEGKKHAVLEGHKMTACWSMEEHMIGNKKDPIFIGASLFNAIDGTVAINMSGWTFRPSCSNMVHMMPQLVKSKARYLDSRDVVAAIYRRHTKGLDLEGIGLLEQFGAVMETMKGIVEAYNELAVAPVTYEVIRNMKRSQLPRKALPDWAKGKEHAIVVPDMTQWELYNYCSDKIWHSDSSLGTKTEQMNIVHRTMPIMKAKTDVYG